MFEGGVKQQSLEDYFAMTLRWHWKSGLVAMEIYSRMPSASIQMLCCCLYFLVMT